MKCCSSEFSSLLFCALLLCGSTTIAQDDKPVEQRKLPLTVRMDGGISFINSSKALKDNFYSVGDVNLAPMFGIYKGFKLGLHLRYTGFQVSRNASNFNDEVIIDNIVIYQPIRTTHNMYSASIAAAYDRWITPYSLFSFGISSGKSLVRYNKIRKVDNPPTKDQYNYTDDVMDASVTFMYFFEDRMAMSIKFGYAHLFAPFRPETVALDGGAISYTSEDLKGEIGFFNVGLGFAWSLKRID